MGATLKKIRTSKKRRYRGQRQKGRPVVLTERDLNIMTFVGLCQYCSTEHIRIEFFSDINPCRCNKRLRQLYDANFLDVTLISSQEPNLHSLSSKGLNELRKRVPEELSSRLKLSAPIQQSGVSHHLAVVDTRLYISSLARKFATPLLSWSNSGGETTSKIGLDEWRLKPDGIAELETKKGVVRIACEVDCGTESARVLANKLSKYTDLGQLQIIDELWFIVTNGKQRVATISRLALKENITSWTRVMHQDHILKRPVQNPLEFLDQTSIF